MNPSHRRFFLLLLFFLSGFSYLSYEIAWVRQATLTFGVSIYAYSAVLTAYMGGMALGGFLIRKWADKLSNPIRIFAWFQLGLVGLGFLTPYLLEFTTGIYSNLAKSLTPSPLILMILRLVLSIIPLSLPSICIGASFPLVGRAYAIHEGNIGSDLGRLYAIHTLGSVAGCLLTATVFIRTFGLRETIALASSISLFVAIAAFRLAEAKTDRMPRQPLAARRRKAPAKPAGNIPKADSYSGQPMIQRFLIFVLWAYALSGFISLAYEVVWARLISLYTVGAVYSFSIMLAVYLSGLVLGSLAGTWIIHRWKASLQAFGLLEMGIGLLAIGGLFVFNQLANLSLEEIFGGYSIAAEMAFEGLLSTITLLPVTVLLGTLYPVVSSLYTREQPQVVGQKISLLNALNTTGSILGSLLAGFLIIPVFGLQKSMILLAAANLIIGLVSIWLFQPNPKWPRAISIGLAVAALLAVLVLPEPKYLGYWKNIENLSVYYREGIEATVAVFNPSNDNPKFSTVNGRVEVPTDVLSMRAFYLLGHLPPILNPEAQNALMLSFGNGIASGAMASHKIPSIEVVELAKEMVDAAGSVYTKENRGITSYPGLKIHIEDARNFLLQTDQRYDMITTDATHPSNSSSWALFTLEFYQSIREHLQPDGIIIQWVPLHSLSIQDYLAILRTYQSVFPNATLWYTGGQHTLLLATPELLTKAILNEKLKSASAHLETVVDLGQMDEISRYWIMNSEQLRQFTGEGKLVKDNNANFLPDNSETASLISTIQKAAIQANP